MQHLPLRKEGKGSSMRAPACRAMRPLLLLAVVTAAAAIPSRGTALLARKGSHVDLARALRVLGRDRLRALEHDTRCQKSGQYPAAPYPYTAPAPQYVSPPAPGYMNPPQGVMPYQGVVGAAPPTVVVGPDPGVQRCMELCGVGDAECEAVCTEVKELLCSGEFTPEAVYVAADGDGAAAAAVAAANAVQDAVASALTESEDMSNEATNSLRESMRKGIKDVAKATRKSAAMSAHAAAVGASEAASQAAMMHATSAASTAAAAAAAATQAGMTTSHRMGRRRRSSK